MVCEFEEGLPRSGGSGADACFLCLLSLLSLLILFLHLLILLIPSHPSCPPRGAEGSSCSGEGRRRGQGVRDGGPLKKMVRSFFHGHPWCGVVQRLAATEAVRTLERFISVPIGWRADLGGENARTGTQKLDVYGMGRAGTCSRT